MPQRKKPPSLQSWSLRRIGHLFKTTVNNVVEDILERLHEAESGQGLSFVQLRSLKMYLLSEPITQIQTCFFVDTAHYFHDRIVKECLVSLSDLVKAIFSISTSGEIPCPQGVYTIMTSTSRPKLRKDLVLEFLDILCYPGAVIKHVNISANELGSRWNLHWAVISRLCEKLADMPKLESLNLGHWSCRQYSLMADHNQNEGWPLQYLVNLKELRVSNVSEKFFQAIGNHCSGLKRLHVFASDITDTVTWWVAKCQNLEVVELFDDRDVTPVGYAQLLKANPNLKSLGRCDCFGQVLYLMYDSNSLYRSHYLNIPEHLSLEEVDTNGELVKLELKHLVRRCPNLKKIRFKYSQGLRTKADEEDLHLAELASLNSVTQISITSANFYEHHVFQLLELRGDQIVNLELIDIGEINLNAVIIVGAHCPSLNKFCVHGCQFQMQPEDTNTVEAMCNAIKNNNNSSSREDRKRVRLTSASSGSGTAVPDLLFAELKSLDIYLENPSHMPVFQLLISMAPNLERLIFDQHFADYDESLITRSLFEWSDFKNLRELKIGHGSRLSIVAVNVILANCGELRSLGRLDQWGRVTREQVDSIRTEIKSRNLDLVLHTGAQLQ